MKQLATRSRWTPKCYEKYMGKQYWQRDCVVSKSLSKCTWYGTVSSKLVVAHYRMPMWWHQLQALSMPVASLAFLVLPLQEHFYTPSTQMN